MTESIGFIGFGEAAYNIAVGFSAQGGVDLYAYDVMFSKPKEQRTTVERRVSEANVTPVGSIEELLQRAEILFLIVPGKYAEGAAREALPYMTPSHLFADLTTNSPAIKASLGQAFEKKGVLYIDASVMGAVPLYRHKTPTLVCGNGAQKMIARMTPLGMDLTDVGPEAGKAVKMKLTRSIFVKGVEALTLEMLMTARKLGIEKEIVSGVEESFRKFGFVGFCGQLVTSNVQHSGRRALEAKECAELEEELGLNSIMMEAASRKLQWSADLGFTAMTPQPECSSLEDLYELWDRTGAYVK